ncbi:MAG: acyl-CoA dehydrogenase [Thermodesulfobacteriota bacterium]|jgi:alkylation response protein AidB-like acyl-CoA dehydrogenase
MDFDYTPQEEAFRQELRAWLAANRPEGYDPDTFEELDQDTRFAVQLRWQKKLFAAGWVGIHWPKEYGGRGATVVEQAIYQQEMARVKAPGVANPLGISIVGPTLMLWGTEEQKKRYIPKILSAEEIWCQGYSEPGAGSDFASLQTRAVEEGDDFVVNGQKVWTSYAHKAHYCILVVRTDPHAPKHKGLSYLLVDMKSPGITVRPLVQITGDAEFNEVFFEDVRVPRANLVGEKNQGWQVAVTTLMFERANFGIVYQLEPLLRQLTEVAKRVRVNGHTAAEDPAVRQKIAQFYTETQAIKYNGFRQLTRQLKGAPPGPEGSVGKLAASELNLRIVHFAMELLGPYSQCALGEELGVHRGYWSRRALGSRLYTIAGGTSEIMRNIIGDRVLGLPKG